MLTRLFFQIVNHWPKGRRVVFRWFFEYLNRRSLHLTAWTQMNYGYAEGPGEGHTVELQGYDEHERYCHQLYLKTVHGFELCDKTVIEVSCGRGGGASFIYRYLHPRTVTGIDIASSAIAFCRNVHRGPGLRFLQGDAEELPLFDESAEALINVEASFCYADFDRFLAEARRVLRRGGLFIFADLRHRHEVAALDSALSNAGLDLLRREDITSNVLLALKIDAGRRIVGTAVLAPPLLSHAIRTFAGTPGSRIPALLASGKMQYLAYVMRKPENARADSTAGDVPASGLSAGDLLTAA